MQEPGDARLRRSTRLFTLGILLLLIGHGAYRETMNWAKLFADKPLLRFVTYVGDSQGLGAEIGDISYYESTTINPGRTLDVWCSRGLSFKVHQFPPQAKDERYSHMVEVYGGSENVVCKGELLILVSAGEGRSTEVLRGFDEAEGPINSRVVLKAIGSSYRAFIERVIGYIEHHGLFFGLPSLLYSWIRLCFYRPLVALSYYFPLSIHRVASLIAYVPGLVLVIMADVRVILREKV